MTTAANVDAVWNTSIWSSATVLALTHKIYQYAITEDSEKEISRLYFEKYINFIQAVTTRSVSHGFTSQKEYKFLVEISYFRHKDPDGDNWGEVRDFFDTLYSLVVSALSASWTGTVDYWQPQEGPAQISEVKIDGETVWQGKYTFQGFKVA